ncbi:hypothetical protein [Nocardioides dilutus]
MSSIRNSYPAMQIPVFSAPSTFGMPACGHAFGSADVTTGVIAVQAEVRVKGDMGLNVRTYATPGTSAWSPPPS